MSLGTSYKLNSGTEIPTIGLGTWQASPGEVADAVKTAVKNGYRHLDLARVYGNQDEIGGALKELIPSVVKREELFITSKLWNNAHKPENVLPALDETLKQLGTPYLDLYLIHWPVAFKAGSDLFPKSEDGKETLLDGETSIVDTWKAMLALPKDKVKAVGVSNFTIPQLEAIIKATGQAPAANQIEAHPHLPQDDLVAFSKEKNIHLTAYSPLGNNSQGLPLLTEAAEVKEVAEKIGATTGQVLIAWGVKRGYSVIPKSVQESRIIGNFKQIELSDEDYKTVSQISKGKNSRFNIPINYAPSWPIDVFGEPEEAKAGAQVKLA